MSEIKDIAGLLPEVIKTAQEAGKIIMKHYESGSGPTYTKDDNSPITMADIEAHRHISARLKELTSEYPVLSEESTKKVDYETRKNWVRHWLVDPLDGTKEFLKRNGEFTVNIALIEAKRPVLGVVCAPVLEKTYYACRGDGAFRIIKNGAPESIRVSDYRQGPIKVVASRSHKTLDLMEFLKKLGDCQIKDAGSSLKFLLVAEGSAHMYPRLGLTMEWDTAAAHIIVEEAGGHVSILSGEPLEYNREEMLNPFFMVTGDPPYPWRELV